MKRNLLILAILTCSQGVIAATKSMTFICTQKAGSQLKYYTDLTIKVNDTSVTDISKLRGQLIVMNKYGFPPITDVDQAFTPSAVDSQNGTGAKAALLVSRPDGDFEYRAYVAAPLDFYKRKSFEGHLQGTRRNSDTNKTETYLSFNISCKSK